MKRLPLIVPVLALFSLYVLSSPIIWATYYVYQDYIAEEFCVNKQNPDCCGKCYINEVEDEQPANALPRIEVRTPELMSFVILKLKFHPALFRIPISFTSICSGDVSIGFPPAPIPSSGILLFHITETTYHNFSAAAELLSITFLEKGLPCIS